MRFLLAGSCVTLTAVGLATIHPDRTPAEDARASGIVRESRLRADTRFLSSGALGGTPGALDGRLAREYVAARFEAIGLEPAAADGSWFQPVDPDGTTDHDPESVVNRRPGPGSAHVVGRLRGRDPELGVEVLLYTAMLGRSLASAASDGDPLAREGRSQRLPEVAALLSIAEAFAALPERPRRSVVFAAIVPQAGLAATDALAVSAMGIARRIVATVPVGGKRGAGALPASRTPVEDVLRLFVFGARVADSPLGPRRPADEDWDAARQKALAALGTR